MTALHADELPIDDELVRALVAADLPDLAGLPVRRLGSSGSTNALFRLGEDLLVRLPRQPGGTETIEKEARWAPYVGAALPVPTPRVLAVGHPGHGYPERWSVVRWIDGHPPAPHSGGAALAEDLAAALQALSRLSVTEEARTDPALRWYRGLALTTRDADVRQIVEQVRALGIDLDLDAVVKVWDEAVALPGADVVHGERWYHGDLFCENVLVRDGRLAGLLDLGGLAVGDPTVDLIVAWEVLDRLGRDRLRALMDVDEPTWLRGRAWALSLAIGVLPYYWRTMPDRCATKLAVARAVLDDAFS